MSSVSPTSTRPDDAVPAWVNLDGITPAGARERMAALTVEAVELKAMIRDFAIRVFHAHTEGTCGPKGEPWDDALDVTEIERWNGHEALWAAVADLADHLLVAVGDRGYRTEPNVDWVEPERCRWVEEHDGVVPYFWRGLMTEAGPAEQHHPDHVEVVDEIRCRRLVVVGPDGFERIVAEAGEESGSVTVNSQDGEDGEGTAVSLFASDEDEVGVAQLFVLSGGNSAATLGVVNGKTSLTFDVPDGLDGYPLEVDVHGLTRPLPARRPSRQG